MASRYQRASNDEYRPLTISYDGLARVDGSARFGFGEQNVALASVSGPIEVRLAQEQPNQATFEVLVRPISNVPATQSKAQAAVIRAALTSSLILTKNPRTLVQLTVQNLVSPSTISETDGQVAAMINAATLALLNAGSIPMRGVVCAIAIGRTKDDTVLVDPLSEEDASLMEGGCFAFMFVGENEATCVWTNWRSRKGGFKLESLDSAKSIARVAAARIYMSIKDTLGKADSDAMDT
ncbi:exosome component Rrp46 [Coprinopsis sp. MPI-PUGE-AT-0042]|nr:exosome component Rrp46 [Coprinopsis sp. MPI-PUGE-AT-0042]